MEPEVRIDKRTKEYKNSLPESGLTGDDEADAVHDGNCPHGIPRELCLPCYRELNKKDFSKCSECGAELLPDEKSSTCQAPCRACVWKDA